MHKMRWHPEVLTKKQATTLRSLVPVTNALDAGLGAKNSQGLGMVEVMKRRSETENDQG